MKTLKKMFSPWSEVTSGERNQVVFENLNQTYGAYQIRTNYDQTLFKVFSAIGLSILLLSSGLILLRSNPVSELIIPSADPVIFNPYKTPEQIFIPKNPDPPRIHAAPKIKQILVPIVTTEQKETDDKIIPTDPINNNIPIGTPCDSCSDDPGLIPGIPKGGSTIIDEEPEIYDIGGIDILPHFPGGDAELYRFLSNNAHIPEVIKEIGNVKEKVGVVFVVDKDGSVTNIELKHSSKYKELNNEAIRVVKKMPKWEPGMQNGNPVKVRLIIPMRFEVK